MDNNQRRRMFQKFKAMTIEQFWQWQNESHSDAYFLGIAHMKEAMECHPRIYKPMIEQVMQKAREIRVNWDGIEEVIADENSGERTD